MGYGETAYAKLNAAFNNDDRVGRSTVFDTGVRITGGGGMEAVAMNIAGLLSLEGDSDTDPYANYYTGVFEWKGSNFDRVTQ